MVKAEPIIIDADSAAAELCKRSLSFFVQEFWDIIVPNPLTWNWHMDALCNEIQAADERVFLRQPKLYDLVVNVPPGTSKTKIFSVMSTAWEFARMPQIKVFVGSYSDGAVSGISDDIRLLMKSEKYQKFFPKTIIRTDRDSLHNFKTSMNGEFYAFTVGGTLTSKHADILKVDDPINPKQATSQAALLSANHFMDKTLPTRKVDKEVTPIYLVMQRLATNDPTGHLLEKKAEKIRHVCLPAVKSKNVSPIEYAANYQHVTIARDHKFAIKMGSNELYLLDAERLNADVLDDMLVDLGRDGYAGQFDQTPIQEGGSIWRKWFIEVDDAVFPPLKDLSLVGTDWDLAYTEKDDNSASAYITGGKLNNKGFIDDLGWVRYEFPELVRYIKTKKRPHYIEAKGPGKSMKPTLTKSGVPAIEVPVHGGSDKVARARMATPFAEAGMVYIRKSLADRLYNDSRQGILNFPRNADKDLADVLSQFIQRIFRGHIVSSNSGSSESALDSA